MSRRVNAHSNSVSDTGTETRSRAARTPKTTSGSPAQKTFRPHGPVPGRGLVHHPLDPRGNLAEAEPLEAERGEKTFGTRRAENRVQRIHDDVARRLVQVRPRHEAPRSATRAFDVAKGEPRGELADQSPDFDSSKTAKSASAWRF